MLSQKTYRLLTDRPRCDTSILTQLRSGHVTLQLLLRKIKAEESALCPHCSAPESVSHFLLYCSKYTDQRQSLHFKTGIAASSMPWLLNDAKVVPHTLRYIADTKRFSSYLDVGKDS